MNKLTFLEETEGFADYKRLGKNHGKKVYTFDYLHQPEIEAAILKARQLWRKASSKVPDVGSCVLGNGLVVAVRPPKKRTDYQLKICHPMGQTENPGWQTMGPVIEFLKENGIECWYECGWMD